MDKIYIFRFIGWTFISRRYWRWSNHFSCNDGFTRMSKQKGNLEYIYYVIRRKFWQFSQIRKRKSKYIFFTFLDFKWKFSFNQLLISLNHFTTTISRSYFRSGNWQMVTKAFDRIIFICGTPFCLFKNKKFIL